MNVSVIAHWISDVWFSTEVPEQTGVLMNAPVFSNGSENGHMSSEYWSEALPYISNLLLSFSFTQIPRKSCL